MINLYIFKYLFKILKLLIKMEDKLNNDERNASILSSTPN